MEGAQSALRHRWQWSKAASGAASGAASKTASKAANGETSGEASGEASPAQGENPLVKAALFSVLVVHTLLIYLTIKTMKMQKINHKLKEESIIFVTEIMKLAISTVFYLHENKFNLTSVRENMADTWTKKRSYLVSLTVPSVLYYFQNIFFYISISSIPIPLFQMLYQFRILVVVIFTFILLKRRVKISQLISIAFLFLSLVCLKDYNLGSDAPNWGSGDAHSGGQEIGTHSGGKEIGTHSGGKEIGTHSGGKEIGTHSGGKMIGTTHIEGKWKAAPLKDNAVENLRDILIHNLKTKCLKNNTRFDFYTLSRAFKKGEVSPNMLKPKKTTRNNIIVGVLTTFLATFTSGFSSVFLESLYLNYRHSFWFQNMCLAFFTIILSLSTSRLHISSALRGEPARGDVKGSAAKGEAAKENAAKEEAIKANAAKANVAKANAAKSNTANQGHGAPREGEEQPDGGPPPNGVPLFLSNHFNSVKEFLYVALLILLNSVGGIITSVFIKHVGSLSRFFVTPISLLFNIYISSIYFKDFRFTTNYFISLVFVSFSLFFYVRGRF
ncbi:conserved Plasmodium protein, unknown function [Plasmodium vivax]|uniref:UDP-N-acetylglucosamine transporter n=1 Tax=Plasmodium vivax TaxID=5855 RepID=A0A1G4HEE6_PLAVI|nr:conserved Plasmodium protein, unknown function [Plasmodium vivax]